MRRRFLWCLIGPSALVLSFSSSAPAAPPGNWSLAVERVFGYRRSITETEVNGQTDTSKSSSVALFSNFVEQDSYPSARFALDYLFNSGVSLGGALAFQLVTTGDGDDSRNGWLLAPRVGYFAAVTSGFGIWPRAGLTYVTTDFGGDNDLSATAITLEVPLVFSLGGRSVGLSMMPYLDFGVGGGTDEVDRTLTEFGLQFGLNVFF
ncbi:MAG TPA: hypothetical protein VJU61_07890 [Polyangiaceae bacterium]|nr:hypothetical protein [Polyangiaceae bacterium]